MDENRLPRVRFGMTGWEVTRLGLGTIPLIKQPDEASEVTLNRALDAGINLIDTAEQYENMQERIGRFISQRRSEYFLTTKTYSRTAQDARRSLEDALKAMRTNFIDGYMLHSVSSTDEWDQVRKEGGAIPALQRAREEGLIDQIGVSIHRDLRVMREAIESGLFGFIMLAYSPLDQENVGAEILPLARRRGLGVMLMKAMAGGQLVPERADMPPAEGDMLKRLVLRFSLSNPNIDVAVVGMNSIAQVDFNVTTCREPLSVTPQDADRMWRLIARVSKDFRYGQMCLRCQYCQPCPQGVPVPEVFRAGEVLAGYGKEFRSLAEAMYERLHFDPSMCVECGQCMEKCPAGIDIPAKLREVAAAFGARVQ